MRRLFVIASFLVAACGSAEKLEQPTIDIEMTETERLLADGSNTETLNQTLPQVSFGWFPHDGQLDDQEEQFLRVVRRLRLQEHYASEDNSLVTHAPCRYNNAGEQSHGALLVRTAGGELWLLEEVTGTFNHAGRGRFRTLGSSDSFLFSTNYRGHIAVTASDINRFVNIVEVLCPEDGDRYAHARMAYRFPRLFEEDAP